MKRNIVADKDKFSIINNDTENINEALVIFKIYYAHLVKRLS